MRVCQILHTMPRRTHCQIVIAVALSLCVGIYFFKPYPTAETRQVEERDSYDHGVLLNEGASLVHSEGSKLGEGIKTRLEKRKRILEDACMTLGHNRSLSGEEIYQKNKYLAKSLFYSDKWKILMCLIPKCATRSQATFLALSDGHGKEAYRSPYQIAEKYLSPRTAKTVEEVAKRINDYTKIVVGREPFSRLLSAYRDKIEGGGRGENYKRINGLIRKRKQNATDAVSFSDFVGYLTQAKGDPQVDPHWNYYHRLCSPCELNFTYVVHLDTIEEDMQYIVTKLGMKNYTFPPSFNSFTDSEKVKKYFNEVPPAMVNDLYHRYQTDYNVFAFPPPPQF